MKDRKVVFLDRDGTLIHDRPGHYLRSPEKMKLYSYTANALQILRKAGYRLVVVTNQSGLGHGYLTEVTLREIHAQLKDQLRRHGARLDGIYYCPHTPEDLCACRKPQTTLARRAIRDLKLSLRGAAIIGDKKADVDLGRRLKITSILIRTGHGRSQLSRYGRQLKPAHIATNLLTAARWLARGCSPLRRSLSAYSAKGLARSRSSSAPSRRAYSASGLARRGLLIIATMLTYCLTAYAQSMTFPVTLTSATVSDPYQLIEATATVTPELSQLRWFPEHLEFEVGWGILSVGTANMQFKRPETFNGTPAVRIISEARSNSFCDAFYKVRDINEAWIDARQFSSLGYYKRLREGHFFRDEWVLYDYPQKAFLSKTTNKDQSFSFRSGPIPGPVQDILSSLYYIRTKPLKVGDEIILDVNTRENWPLVVKVLRKQRIKVPAGKFDCVVVEPFLRKEGIFIQKGKRMQVWLTDDERHIPVKLSVEVFFGHVTAELLHAS